MAQERCLRAETATRQPIGASAPGGPLSDSTALRGSLSISRRIRRFTPEEDALIRNWPQDRSLRELAQLLGREYGTVKVRYWRLRGIKTQRQPRPSSRRSQRGTPDERQRLQALWKLLLVTLHLRRHHLLRGELATAPNWAERLLQAVARHARRQASMGLPSLLDDPGFLDEFFQPPLAGALGAGLVPDLPNGPGAARPESQHGSQRSKPAPSPGADAP